MRTERIQTPSGELVTLIADEGKLLTDQQETFFAEVIYLGINDSPENYREVEQTSGKDHSPE